MEKYIIANGCALRVSDTGWPRVRKEDDGEAVAFPEHKTIVLLHGYLESIEVWDDFTDLLNPWLRVIAVDLPGHGISEVKGDVHTMEYLADTVNDALRQLEVDRCIVCGHSMGGYAALEFLRKYPAETEGIILFHSVPFADTPEKKAQRDREIEVVLAGKKDLLAAGVVNSFAPANRKRMANRIEELADQVFLTEDTGVLALLRGMEQRRDNNDTLSESHAPQMFIFGRGDELITPEAAAEIIRLHPRATVAWLENSGHMGFVEEPQAAADAILDFVKCQFQ